MAPEPQFNLVEHLSEGALAVPVGQPLNPEKQFSARDGRDIEGVWVLRIEPFDDPWVGTGAHRFRNDVGVDDYQVRSTPRAGSRSKDASMKSTSSSVTPCARAIS